MHMERSGLGQYGGDSVANVKLPVREASNFKVKKA